MEILIVSVAFPYPIDDGGRAGSFKIIEHLRKNNNITLICPNSSKENLSELLELWPNVEIIGFQKDEYVHRPSFLRKLYEFIKPAKKLSKAEAFRNVMWLNTTDLVNYYLGDLVAVCQKTIAAKEFDVVQVDFIEVAPIVHFLPTELPKAFIHHEIRHKRMGLEQKTLPEQTHADSWFIENTKVFEIGILNKYDKVICVSDVDKASLSDAGVLDSKLETSPSPVAIKNHNVNKPFKFTNRIVYLGPEVHYPNLDGVDWFLTNVWSNVLAENPNIEFDIIGNWSVETIDSYAHFENLNFLGFVENLADVLEGAIMIVPLRLGTGMRMKILEAASWNMPIISTNVGAEGLPVKHGEDCFIVDEASEFSEAILTLSNSASLQSRFSSGISKAFKNQYSLEQCGEIRETILRKLSQGK